MSQFHSSLGGNKTLNWASGRTNLQRKEVEAFIASAETAGEKVMLCVIGSF